MAKTQKAFQDTEVLILLPQWCNLYNVPSGFHYVSCHIMSCDRSTAWSVMPDLLPRLLLGSGTG